ncbi:MAG: isocitrate/isopropylmalate dehydrogenase family protein [Peptococcaceae bacterium]
MMHNVTLLPGDGIGPEISEAVTQILACSGADIKWDIVKAGGKVLEEQGVLLPEEVLDSIKKNRVALKGPLTTPIGKGFKSINVSLRKQLGLYANFRPVKSLPGIKSPFKNVDIIIVRENTEDLYIGQENKISENRVEAIKVITREASMQIGLFAFTKAREMGRKKVTAVHKANILKYSDGLFLECLRAVSKDFPEITYEEMIIDNLCMQLVQRPETFDVLVLPNLYGDIVSDLCAGLVGGLGLVPGANIGDDYSVFEAVHGSAPDIAGKNVANPLALLQSALLLLKHIGEVDAAGRIEKAMLQLFSQPQKLTPDLGGSGTTSSIAKEICSYLNK